MDGKPQDDAKTPPPGEGEGLEEASKGAVEQMKDQQDGARHAGYGDGG
ncbi:MAG TPA: hypothetical protein VGB48_07680 [Allosphingosinicella sp.]